VARSRRRRRSTSRAPARLRVEGLEPAVAFAVEDEVAGRRQHAAISGCGVFTPHAILPVSRLTATSLPHWSRPGSS